MPAVELSFWTFTRFAPDESAEVLPANSSVAPEATVAVAPAPTVAEPLVAVNRTLPAEIASELPAAKVGGAVTRNVPAPPDALAATFTPLAPDTFRLPTDKL